jgi:glycosyltransferase involved in cell wall biosynthesis
MPPKVRISIVTPCYNEAENVDELYERVCAVIKDIPAYDFVLLFIDNHSTDDTVQKIKRLAAVDKRVRLIVNMRNFGHIRSPYHGILNGGGAATIYLASDLQDPPELIPEFIRYWEQGFKVVYAAKPIINASPVYAFLRKTYYRILDTVSDAPLVKNITGFGIYDREVIDTVREIADPFPYLRGLICDIAMLGLVSHSKVPLRLAAFAGFVIGLLSLGSAALYAILKLIFWDTFPLGIAPLIIAIFFLFGMMFLFIGVLGEYVASIHTYVQRRPVVIEQERVNFDDGA